MRRKLTDAYIIARFKECSSIKELQQLDKSAYNAACKRGLLATASSHMISNRRLRTIKECATAASKCNSKAQFKKEYSKEYQTAHRYDFLKQICGHMKSLHIDRNLADAKLLSSKYSKRIDFLTHEHSTYEWARINGHLNEICAHMPLTRNKRVSTKNVKRSFEEARAEASKYSTKVEFLKNSRTIYQFAARKGFLDEICQHMADASGSSTSERHLFELIKEKYPKTQKLRDRKIKIPEKPHIQGFDIDIYVPELRKGIEFDGTYHHSFYGLERGRPKWPVGDLENYHRVKDEYFKSKGIELLHISEREWLANQHFCVRKCFDFLEK
jgi:hypothetical protein